MLPHVLNNCHCGSTSFSRGSDNVIKVPKLASGLEIDDMDAADDGTVNPAAVLLDMFLQEREDTLASCLFLPPAGARGPQLACPLCFWRRFCRKVTKLEDHLREDHSAAIFYLASGKKQLKVAMALFEADAFSGRRRGRYLERSASRLREQIPGGVPANALVIDVVCERH